jgi:hypothetical protein
MDARAALVESLHFHRRSGMAHCCLSAVILLDETGFMF